MLLPKISKKAIIKVMKAKPIKLAVFDIDGTIFRSSLVIELSHALVEAGIFPQAAKREIAKEYLAWLDRKGTYEAYINKVVKIYIKHICGQRYNAVKRIAENVIAYQKDRVYRYTRDLIKQLKKQNYFLVAISGSPSYIVEAYAKAIGFNLFFGTELEIKDGKFTGNIANLDSAYNKAGIIKALAKQYPTIKLKKSLAVGDTESDMQMLSLVGQPIAFNPNMELAKIAQKKQWKVVVERKDVVFGVSKFEFLNKWPYPDIRIKSGFADNYGYNMEKLVEKSKLLYEDQTFKLNGIAFKVHKELGRFAREKQYCDLYEKFLIADQIPYKRELTIADSGNRLDFFVYHAIPIDMKAKPLILKEDYYQMQRYLQAVNAELGIIYNFRDKYIKPKRVLRETRKNPQQSADPDDVRNSG